MSAEVRPARSGDVPALLAMMAEFYAESGYQLDRPEARTSFETILGDPRLGRMWLVEDGGEAAGYVVVTFVFAMEHGGTLAVVDDFFVRPSRRGRGLGTAALAHVRRDCVARGVRAMRVEVGPGNEVAHAVYRRNGFVNADHVVMTATLLGAPPCEPHGA